jgi:hypothetical protein
MHLRARRGVALLWFILSAIALADAEADLLTSKNEVKANPRRSLSHLPSQWPTAEHKAAIEAAGLKLEQRKLPKKTIVIDHFGKSADRKSVGFRYQSLSGSLPGFPQPMFMTIPEAHRAGLRPFEIE